MPPSGAMRAILPKKEQVDSPPFLTTVPEPPKLTKRRCISNACIPCRKRKSKCDGGTPTCSTCTAVYNTECAYGVNNDLRRNVAFKRDIETLHERSDALGVIVASIRSSTDAEVADIVQRIRANEDYERIAETVKRTDLLPEVSESNSLEGDLSYRLGRPARDKVGEIKHFGHTSGLGLIPEAYVSPTTYTHAISEAWTRVTDDNIFLDHLLELYFAWMHPFYTVFPKDLFLHDMSRGQSKYCSALLVNAILASACCFSDDPESRADPSDPSTSGDHFFAEAKELLSRQEHSNLTTVQALALMGLREASSNHESSGFSYSGRCMRMIVELGLHLSFDSSVSKLSSTEISARRITFWGCFTLDTAWAVCCGRISQLPRAAINLDLPEAICIIEPGTNKTGVNSNVANAPQQDRTSNTQPILYQFSLLSQIVNDTVSMFFAPRQRCTKTMLLQFNSRYLSWYKGLPPEFRISEDPSLRSCENPSPELLQLHMYYHSAVLLLFRPFLKVVLMDSEISPRQKCTESARKISSLASTYNRIYGLRCSIVTLTHLICTACIIHLLDLPDISAARDLEQGIRDLKNLAVNHAIANRYLHTILGLSEQWHMRLPENVARAVEEIKSVAVPNVYHTLQASALDSSSQPLLSKAAYHYDQVSKASPLNSAPVPATLINTSNPFENPSDLFWSPFPDQSLPFQPTPEVRPMDIAAMIGNDDLDQLLIKDGFKLANLCGPVSTHASFYDPTNWDQTFS